MNSNQSNSSQKKDLHTDEEENPKLDDHHELHPNSNQEDCCQKTMHVI
ncbi:unnamed protein product [marine sediment metagenome]|uniref:Uncharacterized protein n=1 Tax=marine sediment metagenome TaxID=412755 RepID=X1ERM1_9ZZZZ